MAASSSSQYQIQERTGKRSKVSESSSLFDVFINHRGPDVKQTLATELYNSLGQLGIHAFLDSEEKELGISSPLIIETAILSAKVHIAIFSKRYAESAWCLAELVLMLQSEAKIIPVFYEVEPRELRHIEKGAYADAFRKYEEKGRYLEKLSEWKEALNKVSFISGIEFYSSSDCKTIVAAVKKEVQRKRCLVVAKYPVGLHNLVKDFESRCLDELVKDFENQCGLEERKDKASIVGIFGMGGLGKTTLAKELFNRKHADYSGASFLFDVREASVRGELPRLQSQLVKDLFHQEQSFRYIEEGTSYLRDQLERSHSLNFLIVVDDIDHVEQLNALLIMDILNKSDNSLIIVTARDVGVVISAEITFGYPLEGMDRNNGRELFCWHAFDHPLPRAGYEAFVEEFVGVCGGLPLSLLVLGRLVHGRDHRFWELKLKKAKKTLPQDVKERLRISFDALEDEEKQVFMDIACFFLNKPKCMAERICEGSGWDAQNALQTLKDKCLLEEEDFVLRMHNHLTDLGREMAGVLSSPRRLWLPRDLESVESMGFRTILAKTNIRCFNSIFDESMGSRVTFFLGQSDSCPETSASLLWLELEDSFTEQSSIPPWIPLQNLQGLKISNWCFQELWHRDAQLPSQLKELRITKCFGGSSLPEDFCALQSLEILELSCCPMLSSLPSRFGDLEKLRYLDLSCCWKLKLRSDMLENITKLEHLDLTRCHELEELPRQITNQAYLTRLFLEGTSIRNLPTNVGELRRLEELRIGSPMLTSLPSSLGNLSCLRNLVIDGCPQLEYLPQSLCHLHLLKQVGIRASGLKELPFDVGSSNIEVTDQEDEAPNSGSNLRPRITENCLQNIWNALKALWIEQTDFASQLPAGIETLSLLANRQLMEIRVLPQSLKVLEICACKMLKNVSGIGNLVMLWRLEIRSCPELDELPSFADLVSLQEFKIQGCPKVETIRGLEQCRSLQILTAEVPLTQSLENVEGLRRLNLTSYTISDLKRCILSMKKCPLETMIRGRVTLFVEPIVDYLSSTNLTVLLLEADADWDNIPRDIFNRAFLWYEEEKESDNEESGISGVKVVQIAVCRKGSLAFSEFGSKPNFRLFAERRFGGNPNFRKRKAMLATGEDRTVVAAFRKLIALLE